MKKLKSIDFKAIFINHGEKIGLGVIILFVVVALSGTSWSRYERSPDDLKNKVNEAKSKITTNNPWPKAKQEQFVVVDFNGQANEVFTPLNTAKYEFTTPLFWPLYRKKEKAREPELLAPLNLIVSSNIAILGVKSSPDSPETTAPATTTDPLADPSSDLKPGPGGAAALPGAGPGAGPGAAPAAVPFNIPTATAKGPGGGHGNAATPMMPPMMPGMPGMPYGGGGASGVSARGELYCAVRAIVPRKEQIEKAMKALNLSYADAEAAIEYTDFILQRQTAIAGPDPWAGPWENVDIQRAKEILDLSFDYEPDPVPQDLQDVVFTMALPYRLLRYWADDATHPSIKNFQLSEAEMQRETMLTAKLLEEAEKLNLQYKPKVERKGLVNSMYDTRSIAKEVMKSGEGMNVMNSMAQQMSMMMPQMGGPAPPKMGAAEIQNRLSASGRLYLFRYFDFDVKPGMAYRYKLKLELKNPNFERPFEEVDNPDFTRGPYRETAWSNISNPTVVPETTRYFLKDVERDPVRDEKHSKKPVANIAMFERHSTMGTLLHDTLRILSVGQFISEKKKSWVLDPATPTFEEKDVPFVTDDVLVDASGDMEISPELHPDLQLKAERSKKEVKVGMLAEALVATGVGELKEIDPISGLAEEKLLKQRVDEERKNFLALKDAPKESKSTLDGGGYPMMPPMAGPGGMQPPMAGRGNPRRKPGKSDAGASAAPGGAHGGSGGGAAGAAGSQPPGRKRT